MLEQNKKITVAQIVILVSTSRIFTIMTHAQNMNEITDPLAKIFGSLLAILILIILMTPSLLLYKKYNNINIIDIINNKSRICGIIVTIGFIYLTTTTMITGVVGFEYFLSNAVYPQASATTVITSLTIVCLICASYGLQGIARAGTFIFVIFTLAFIFIISTSTGEINMLNIKPILENPVQQSVEYSIEFASRGRGLVVLLLLYPRLQGSKTQATLLTIFITSIVSCIMNFLVIGVLGEYGATQTFPYFALNSVIEIPILQRLDAMHMMTWALMSFVHFSLFGCVTIEMIQTLLPKAIRKFSVIILFVVILVVSIPLSYTGSIIYNTNVESRLLLILLLFILPIMLLTVTKKELITNEI